MKFQIYQLCRWCDDALRGYRFWLWLGLCEALLLLTLVIDALYLPALSFVLLTNAVLVLYQLHRRYAFGKNYQRKPCAKDAQCETILIDAALIGQGTRLRAAAQPIDVADSLSLRLGSGALLMGAAMTLTADTLPPADRAAILSAVQQMNIKPDRMRSHNPVLSRVEQDGLTIVTVLDGQKERLYYLGSPEVLAKHCASIWEGNARPLTEHDHLRIADTARYISQANCRVLAWATAIGGDDPIFLGMAGVGEEIHLQAIQDIAALRAQGLTVMIDPADQPDTDLTSLCALLDLPEHHARADIHLTTRSLPEATALCVTCSAGDSLLEPVSTLRQRFQTIESTLRRFGQMLLFALLIGILTGFRLAPVPVTLLLGAAAVFIGVDLNSPRPHWPIIIISCGLAVIASIFLYTQPSVTSMMASGLITLSAALAAVHRLCGSAFSVKGPARTASISLLAAFGICCLALIIWGAAQGAGGLLPLGFSLLISTVILLLMRFEHKILK